MNLKIKSSTLFSKLLLLFLTLFIFQQCTTSGSSRNNYRNFKNHWSGSANNMVWHFHSIGLSNYNSPIIDDKKESCKTNLLKNAHKLLKSKFQNIRNNIHLKKSIKIISINYDLDYNCEAELVIFKKDFMK